MKSVKFDCALNHAGGPRSPPGPPPFGGPGRYGPGRPFGIPHMGTGYPLGWERYAVGRGISQWNASGVEGFMRSRQLPAFDVAFVSLSIEWQNTGSEVDDSSDI